MSLDVYLAERKQAVEQELGRLVPEAGDRPAVIHQAMRHSLFAGGKRIRPILFWAAAEAVAGDSPGAVAPACSLEMVHTYSLIHDDLPALDNDDFRRGKPTCHKAFGEAMAILAGDALLTRAFGVLAEAFDVSESRRIRMVAELAAAAGTLEGMIGGQVEDLEAEGKPVEEDRLLYIHRSKTGAMIRASVRMGAIYASDDGDALEALSEYGRHIGLAFQIVDDVLDVTQSSEVLGKTAGKDAEQQKSTFPALYGVEESRRKADEHLSAAVDAVDPFGDSALRLRQIAERIVNRSA